MPLIDSNTNGRVVPGYPFPLPPSSMIPIPPGPKQLTREDTLTNADVYVPMPPPPDEDPDRCAILTCQHQHRVFDNGTIGPCAACPCLDFIPKILPGEDVVSCLIRLENANAPRVLKPTTYRRRLRRLSYFSTPAHAPATEWHSSIMRLLACCQDAQLVQVMDPEEETKG